MGKARTAGVVVTSVLLHLIVLSSIARAPPGLRTPPPEPLGPVLDLTLVHRPPLPTERSRPQTSALPAPERTASEPPPLRPRVATAAAPGIESAPGPVLRPTPPIAAGKPAGNCEPELRLLLTAEERRACDTAAAVAAARVRDGFRPGGPVQDISRVPVERALELDAEVEAKRTRNARADAQLAAARAESASRRAPSWTGQGQGVDVTVRVDCGLKFAGFQLAKPKCRMSGSVMP